MAVPITCPEGHKLKVDEKYLGKKIRCPRCQAAVLVEEVLVADVELVELEALAETPAVDPLDPLSNFFGSTDFPDAFPETPSANYSFPVANAYSQPAAKSKAAGKQSSKGSPKVWLIAGGAGGGLALLLLVGLLAFFLSGSRGGSGGAASEKWVLSQTMLDHLHAMNEKAAADPDLGPRNRSPDWLEKELERIRAFDPDYLMIPESREAALKAGKPDPDAERLKQLAEKAINDVFNAGMSGPPIVPDAPPVVSAIVSRLVLLDWRGRLQHVDNVDALKWEKMKKYEQELFGSHSIFIQLEKWDGSSRQGGHKLLAHLRSVDPQERL